MIRLKPVRFLVLILGVVLLTSGTALASDYEVMQVRIPMIVWTWAVFLLVLAVLWKFAWNPLVTGLEGRESRIRSDLEGAEAARKGAEEARQEIESRLAQAGEECEAMLAKGREEARREASEIVDRARKEGEDLKARVQIEIDGATKRAYEDVWKTALALGVEIASKVLEREVTAEDHQKLVAQTVDSYKASLASRRGG